MLLLLLLSVVAFGKYSPSRTQYPEFPRHRVRALSHVDPFSRLAVGLGQGTQEGLEHISPVFAYVNVDAPDSYSDINHFRPHWRNVDNYVSTHKLGEGTFGAVYKGYDRESGDELVIKYLKDAEDQAVLLEIKILQALRDGPDIVRLLDTVRDRKERPALVFELVKNVDHENLYPEFSDFDTRFYMYKLLRSLNYAHSHGVMHRDLKPQNVMIDPHKRSLRLIDWGLATFYFPNNKYGTMVGTRYYKAPEMHLGMRNYDYSIDLWSFGAMFAGIIFKRLPFFEGNSENDQFVQIARVLGIEDMITFLNKYNLPLNPDFHDRLQDFRKKNLNDFVNDDNWHLANPDAIDLLSKLLVYDPEMRLTAQQAMDHPYFDPVRSD